LSGDDSIPESFVKRERIEEGVPAFKLFYEAGLANSGGAARGLLPRVVDFQWQAYRIFRIFDYRKRFDNGGCAFEGREKRDFLNQVEG